jgi:hypothetical protein
MNPAQLLRDMLCLLDTSALARGMHVYARVLPTPVLLGALLALLLMVAVARVGDDRVRVALIAAVPALALLRAWLLRRLADHAGALYLPILSWRLAALLVGGGLTVLLVWFAYHQAYPDFAEVSLERAVWQAQMFDDVLTAYDAVSRDQEERAEAVIAREFRPAQARR